MGTRSAIITGTGMSVPSRVMTNRDLEKIVDTSDDWIRTRTGISERRIVDDDEPVSTFALEASQKAIEMAGVSPSDIELIICATVTPDMPIPATACLLQHRLGCDQRGGLRHPGGLLGVHLRAIGREAVHRQRTLPQRARHRGGAAQQVPRLDRPHDVRHLRRRRGSRRDERGQPAARGARLRHALRREHERLHLHGGGRLEASRVGRDGRQEDALHQDARERDVQDRGAIDRGRFARGPGTTPG